MFKMDKGMGDFKVVDVILLLLVFILVLYFIIKGGLENVLK